MSESPSHSTGRWSARDAEDAALLARIAAGDRVAFESLYRSYFARLSRFLQRMVASYAGRPPNRTIVFGGHGRRSFVVEPPTLRVERISGPLA